MQGTTNFTLDLPQTCLLACFVLLLGYYLVKKINFLAKYNIPQPVVGGFIVALILTLLYQVKGISLSFSQELQNSSMLVFFTCIGLSADFKSLVKGGKGLAIFLLAAFLFIFVQDVIGIILAKIFGLSPAYGLIAGSITLTGGHGTGAAWAGPLTARFHIKSAMELAMACATFGLVFGGLIGGPVASFLLKKQHRQPLSADERLHGVEAVLESTFGKSRINTKTIIETFTMIPICFFVGKYLDTLTMGTIFQLPTFVWCLFVATVVRNALTICFKATVSEETIDTIGNVGLSLFLAIALMSLKLWELAGLALPILIILIVQVSVMIAYAIFVTYRFMGKDYDAIVLSAGHCGFGLGATPTAVANMQSVTDRYGSSQKAFLIIPMVGAFFIDIMNSFALKIFTELLALFL